MSPFLLALLTAVIWGFVPILEKAGLGKISPLVGLFWRCLGVFLGVLILFLWQHKEIRASFSEVHSGMFLLIISGFLAAVVGQVFFYTALKNGEASLVVPLAAAYPLFAFIFGVIFFGEHFTLAKAAGIGCIMLGVFFLK